MSSGSSGTSSPGWWSGLSSGFVRLAVYPVWALRDHPHYFRYRQEFATSQFLPPQAIEELQLTRLRALLKQAAERCPFYRDRFRAAGVDVNAIQSLADLRAVPPLTKSDIQRNGPAMVAEGFPEKQRVRNQTGGSTGSPLQFYVDKERLDSRMASTDRHNLWSGLRPGDWCVYLWGARLDQVVTAGLWSKAKNEFLYRRLEVNTSTILESHWERLLPAIRAKRPRFLLAYANSAVLFGEYLLRNRISDVTFQSIITTAEVLLPEQRKFLEETFRARVFNRYGCREVSVIASECEQHTGLHVNAEALLVELMPDPSVPDGSGKVLVTDLLNQSMPLIRYEIGDVGRWADQKCPCGRGLPLLADIQGRITDFLTLADGRKISGPSLTLVVADMPDVAQVQFVQKGRDSVVLRVVPGRGYGDSTRAELRKRLGLYLQGLAVMDIEEVESIKSELSGKYRFVVDESRS